jgi:hypothetical protein
MDTLEDVNDAVGRLGDALIDKIKIHEIKTSDSPATLEFGKHYHVTELADILLPLGRMTDGYIYLTKTMNAGFPLVSVADGSADLFEVAGKIDTTILYDVERPIVLWWNATSLKWMV